jgi:hypothetical protein
MSHFIQTLFLVLTVLFIGGCGKIGCAMPESVEHNDPRLTLLWKAIEDRTDRLSLGFTSINKDAKIKLEIPGGGLLDNKAYDAMLHFYCKKTARTIAFRKKDDKYVWIGEQEVFYGPKQYTTPDGTFNEEIVMTYEIERVSGYLLNQLDIYYRGPDDLWKEIKIEEALPLIKKWETMEFDISSIYRGK